MPGSAQATVVVVNWNGAHLLPSCLDALAAQTHTSFEVVVVDNASGDDSLDVLARYPAVRVVRNPDNRGFAGGNNSALRSLTTPYAVLLNNDATPEPDWLERLLAPFGEPGAERLAAVTSKVLFQPRFLRLTLSTTGFSPGPADPRTLGVKLATVSVDGVDVTAKVLAERTTYGQEPGFRWTRPRGELLVPVDGPGPYEVVVRWAAEAPKDATLSWAGGSSTQVVTTVFADSTFHVQAAAVDVLNNAGSVVFVKGYGADLGYQEVDEGQYDTPREVFAVCGCAVAFRTEAGRSVDWFDDDFFLYYEDTDLSWRLRLAGWTLRYEPSAVVRHVHSATSVEWSPTFVFHTTRNRLLMLVKDATASRARAEYAAFLGETLQTARPVIGALRRGRRPDAALFRARAKATRSLLAKTPAALRRRRRHHAVVRRAAHPARRRAGHEPMRAAVYNRFWHSQGGGERHSGMIASVLSHDGVEVDLIGHTEVDKDELADHLGLDLSKVAMRIVPDKGDLSVARLSEEYDLFVNGSYMSRLAPRATHNAYLCYFPTPFDAELPTWQRVVLRNLGPLVQAHVGGFDYGTGWYPPEGGRRRRWHWASGDAVLSFPPSAVPRVVRLELGGPAMPQPVELLVETEDGVELLRTTVGPKFVLHRFTVPPSADGTELHFRAPTFTPGGTDTRELSVAASGMRLEGGSYGPRQLLAHHFPWMLRAPRDLSFLQAYDTVMANSEFTRGWIEQLWATQADVLFPPIQVQRLRPAPEREKAVVTVGRFFAPGLGHAKRQKEMVEQFAAASRAGRLPGWRMHVVGGMEDSQRGYVDEVRAAGSGAPVEVHTNAPRSEVERLLSTSSVFWAATGLGEDEKARPWTSEHFGMTTVEAMAGGCVPVVIDRAGQKEIVREGVDGFRFGTVEQLVARTVQLAGDEGLRARLSASATQRAQQFSEDAFADRWHAIARKHELLG